MKVAIYIEDGRIQLVLTPEGDWEQNVTKQFAEGASHVKIKRGSFYLCNGGWTRYASDDESLMFVVEEPRLPTEGTE